MLTSLQNRKFTRLFNVYDVDRSEYIEKSDFERLIANLAKYQGRTLDTPEYKRAYNGFLTSWDNLKGYTDKNNDGRVSLPEFCAYYDKLKAQRGAFEVEATLLVKIIIDMCDKNGDGKLSPDEYLAFLKICQVDDAAANELFIQFDENHDGYLSVDELLSLLVEFYESDDPQALGNSFFGRY